MNRILVPTDYSLTADNAYLYALNFAEQRGADLFVLHVYPTPTTVGKLTKEETKNISDGYKERALKKMREQIATLKPEMSELKRVRINFHFEAREGDVVEEIEKMVKEENIDLVIMGTEGESGFQRKVLGSNTMNTINAVSVPVLSIPVRANFTRLENMVYLTNFTEEEEVVLDSIIKEAVFRNLNVNCIHIETSIFNDNRTVIKKWKKKYEGKPISFHSVPNRINVQKRLMKFIHRYPIDMVVIVHRPRHFIERIFSNSFTSMLGAKMDIPMMVYKKKE